jgi:hypothetical protein
VNWIDNLADHLKVDWKSRILFIYQHKIALWNHIQYTDKALFPEGLLEEAMDTLNLLFPLLDAPTKGFLMQHGKTFDRLGYCKRPRNLSLGRYQYWQTHLRDLIDVFNEHPRGIQQLKLQRDGGNLMQFATFWMAAAVGILTIISIAFGIVQTIFSIKQYELARAQACTSPGAATAMP